MTEISLIKEWCDKKGKDQPNYMYEGFGTDWICKVSWNDLNIQSENCTNKKLAKHNVAKELWSQISDVKQHIKFKTPTHIFIDGDQRMDCWAWLASSDITWENVYIQAFVGPTSHTLESDHISIVKAKTTSKDSADALILMTLGYVWNTKERFLIVSADHILVQAAMDTECVDWAKNVVDLQKYIEENSF